MLKKIRCKFYNIPITVSIFLKDFFQKRFILLKTPRKLLFVTKFRTVRFIDVLTSTI